MFRNNIYIPAPFITVLDETRQSLGSMPTGKAKELANTRGLYLLELDKASVPPTYVLSKSYRLETTESDGVTSATVRLLSADKEMLGVMPLSEARARASEEGLGLIVLNDKQDPNICMIGDPKKYAYDKKKSEKANAKKQKAAAKATEVKELMFPADTSDSSKGDRDRLLAKGAEFMADGHPVKFCVKFRGRQMAHSNDVMDRIMEDIGRLENCTVGSVSNSGNVFSVVCTPAKKK